MESQTSMMLQAYSRDPIAKYAMPDSTVYFTQANSVCGDSLTVFLKIDEQIGIMKERSRDGPAEIQTTAAASVLAEIIQ